MTRVWDTLTCWHSIRCISVFWHLSLFTVLFVSNCPFQTCKSCVSPSHKTRFVHCQILNSDLFVDFISVCDVWARFSEPLLHQVASLVVEWVRELQALQARLHEERHELGAERAHRSSLEDLEDLLEGNWHWISKKEFWNRFLSLGDQFVKDFEHASPMGWVATRNSWLICRSSSSRPKLLQWGLSGLVKLQGNTLGVGYWS